MEVTTYFHILRATVANKRANKKDSNFTKLNTNIIFKFYKKLKSYDYNSLHSWRLKTHLQDEINLEHLDFFRSDEFSALNGKESKLSISTNTEQKYYDQKIIT